jgi:hypothetical protein
MKAAIVLTTINVPALLSGYADNFERYHHVEEISFIVVGDRKTPSEAGRVLAEISARGFEARYVDIPAQERWLRRFPDLAAVIPYNSDNRRNIGYLMAAESGADVIIALDDDNYVSDGDYFNGHSIVGGRHSFKTVSSSCGWYNVCEMMVTNPPRTLYPRGFPYSYRWIENTNTFRITEGQVMVNAGLWLHEPDVDAITRLNEPVKTVRLLEERLMLSPGTNSPINTQNTAFHREVLPCFYYVLMGERVGGIVIDRYGDIFCGFFAKKVIDSLDGRVTFGVPATNHQRNVHNLFRDMRQELEGIWLTDILVQVLHRIRLTSTSYCDAYLELSEAVEQAMLAREDVTKPVKEYFRDIARAQRAWVTACHALGY